MSPYTYKPLGADEIRLVTIHPGSPQDGLRLSIEHVLLNQPPLGTWRCQDQAILGDEDAPKQKATHKASSMAFEALSYTWGSITDAEMAEVVPFANTFAEKVPELSESLPLGHKLRLALRDLRYHNHPRTMWVDAICIDQENPAEVTVQVARAGNVYKQANRVVIWLGLPSHDSSLAIQTINYLGSQLTISENLDIISAPGAVKDDWHHPSVTLPYDAPTWVSIDSLLRRPWFTRVWVVQEAQLGQPVVFVCGEDELPRD